MTVFACDVDGVVANFSEGFSKLLNKLDGLDRLPIITENDCQSWDWKEWYALDVISRADLAILLEEALENNIKTKGNVLWSTLSPLFPEAMEELNHLSKEAPIIFMTRRDGPGAWQETTSWLRRYGINNPMVYTVRPGEEKGDICNKMGITTIIDDSPKYAPELISKGIEVIMPRWGYNKKYIEDNYIREPHLYPVSGLEQSLRICTQLKED